MDSLSALVLSLAPRGTLELHCRFAGGWLVDHGQALPGHLPYHVVLEGRGQVEIGQGVAARILDLAPGDVIVFPHGAAHGLRSIGVAQQNAAPERHFNGVVTRLAHAVPPQLELLCGHFVLGSPGGLLLRTLPEVVVLHTAERADCVWLRGLIGMMRSEAEAATPGSAAVVAQLSTALFTLLLRVMMAESGVAHGLLALLTDARMAGVVEAVLRAPAEPWTVARMAALGHMARATFARRFTQLSGLTPLALVTALRMEQAARLLVHRKMTASQAGAACSYASDAAFGRAFKLHFGLAPKAYVRQARTAAD